MTPTSVDQEPRAQLVAFGRFLKPEMYDVFGEYDLSDLTAAEKNWMNTEQITGVLFDPPRSEDTLVVDGIALNALEYKILARSPVGLGKQAVSRVLGDNDLDDDRIAASQRGVIHVLEKKRPAMAEHLDSLREARLGVRELRKEAKTPGYAHKSEIWMKEHLSVVWNEFKTMLDVLRVQRGWDDTKHARAQAALINYLTQGSQRDRVKNWQGMINLSSVYLSARVALFSNRLRAVDSRLSSKPDDESTQ